MGNCVGYYNRWISNEKIIHRSMHNALIKYFKKLQPINFIVKLNSLKLVGYLVMKNKIIFGLTLETFKFRLYCGFREIKKVNLAYGIYKQSSPYDKFQFHYGGVTHA